MSLPEFFDRLEHACPSGSTRIIALEPRQALFRQGDAPPGLPFLAKGQIDLVRHTAAGQSVRIHVARNEETFAEASIFAEHCHCDAVASMPSTVRMLPTREVRDALGKFPELSEAFAVHLAGALIHARHLLELRAITPLTERVVARLAELIDADGVLPKEITLASIAADLDVTPAALYRAIAALEEQGALARPGRGRVVVLRI